ncbi:MAG: hypothetical protein HOH14_05295 [Gammaproteobacteria bacterium]|nr:hypothetical protein [Gammaproteobacteria bacterium]MBT6042891.1 hypothetical protein [Gammaproteobacteria bacterium]
MVFKDKKVPKHLIIEEEYEIRQRPRKGFFKVCLLFVFLIAMSLALRFGLY